MADLTQLLADARKFGRIPDEDRALRWLRAVSSTLCDWGQPGAAGPLKAALPHELFNGGGSSGNKSPDAVTNGPDGADDDTALLAEVGERVAEEDPNKIAMSLRPLLALVRESLSAADAEKVASALPEGTARRFREADTGAPYPYRLIPQPFGAGRRRH